MPVSLEDTMGATMGRCKLCGRWFTLVRGELPAHGPPGNIEKPCGHCPPLPLVEPTPIVNPLALFESVYRAKCKPCAILGHTCSKCLPIVVETTKDGV